MIKPITLLIAIPLCSWAYGRLPTLGANPTLDTLLTAALLLILATLLITTLINFSQRDTGKRLPWLLLLCLVGAALLIALRRCGPLDNVLLTLLISSLLLGAAGIIGIFAARGLKRPAELIPVCVVTAWADLCSISAGPTHGFAASIEEFYLDGRQGPAPLVDDLLIKTLIPGIPTPVPLFGVTDWIIVAFLTATLTQLQLTTGPDLPLTIARLPAKTCTLHVAPLGLWLALATAQVSGHFVPGLLFICMAVLIWTLFRHPQSRHPTRRELLLTGLFPLLMTIAVVVY
jgi:hypothetical protein